MIYTPHPNPTASECRNLLNGVLAYPSHTQLLVKLLIFAEKAFLGYFTCVMVACSSHFAHADNSNRHVRHLAPLRQPLQTSARRADHRPWPRANDCFAAPAEKTHIVSNGDGSMQPICNRYSRSSSRTSVAPSHTISRASRVSTSWCCFKYSISSCA
jgi:hypothetical protein